MKNILLICSLLLASVHAQSQFPNILLSDKATGRFTSVEPSIIINRKNPNNIIAGVGINRMVVTQDGGKSWTDTIITSPYGVFGDASVISDAKGNLYYFHLADPSGEGRSNDAWLDRMVVHKSTDEGRSWTSGTSIGHNPPKDQDKEWPAVHPTKPWVYLTWTQFDKYGRKDSSCHSNILFSMSKDAGEQWSVPVPINEYPGDCIDGDSTTEGAVPAVDKKGHIYVAWANHGLIYFDRSTDGGKSWLDKDLVAATQPGGWEMTIPGLNRSNGMPVLMIDNSNSPYNGRLYLVWADQRNGANDTDIWFSRSDDKGNTWTAAKRINMDGPGKQQFLPWLAVDQTTGHLYVVYYDRRNHADLNTDVYLAYSRDGGDHFAEVRISETSFTPTAGKFFGDYNNISAHAGIIAPVWTRMVDGKTSVMTCVIRDADLK